MRGGEAGASLAFPLTVLYLAARHGCTNPPSDGLVVSSKRLGRSGARWTGGSLIARRLVPLPLRSGLCLSRSPCLFSLLLFVHLSPTTKSHHVPPGTPVSLSKSQALPVVHSRPLPPSIATPFLSLTVLYTGLLSPTSGPLHWLLPLPGDLPLSHVAIHLASHLLLVFTQVSPLRKSSLPGLPFSENNSALPLQTLLYYDFLIDVFI